MKMKQLVHQPAQEINLFGGPTIFYSKISCDGEGFAAQAMGLTAEEAKARAVQICGAVNSQEELQGELISAARFLAAILEGLQKEFGKQVEDSGVGPLIKKRISRIDALIDLFSP